MNKIIYETTLKTGVLRVYNDKPEIDLIHTHQIHSAEIIKFSNNIIEDNKVDGIQFKISDLSENNFAIKTADCMPIILLGETDGIFLHAGWSGLAKNILENQKIKSIKPNFAFIGPSICGDSFEVTEEFYENFPGSKNFIIKNENIYFDLQQEAKDQLSHLYSGIEVQSANECTMQNNQYNSYRRDKTALRNWSVFSLK